MCARRYSLRLRAPRVTPQVRELFTLVLPATLASGTYYLSLFLYVYFATGLPKARADSWPGRSPQPLPLAIIGSRSASRSCPPSSGHRPRDAAGASKVQAQRSNLACC
jgi:putative peptidoglycan lipid II flippase